MASLSEICRARSKGQTVTASPVTRHKATSFEFESSEKARGNVRENQRSRVFSFRSSTADPHSFQITLVSCSSPSYIMDLLLKAKGSAWSRRAHPSVSSISRSESYYSLTKDGNSSMSSSSSSQSSSVACPSSPRKGTASLGQREVSRYVSSLLDRIDLADFAKKHSLTLTFPEKVRLTMAFPCLFCLPLRSSSVTSPLIFTTT